MFVALIFAALITTPVRVLNTGANGSSTGRIDGTHTFANLIKRVFLHIEVEVDVDWFKLQLMMDIRMYSL